LVIAGRERTNPSRTRLIPSQPAKPCKGGKQSKHPTPRGEKLLTSHAPDGNNSATHHRADMNPNTILLIALGVLVLCVIACFAVFRGN
jgi:hypothetical protein